MGTQLQEAHLASNTIHATRRGVVSTHWCKLPGGLKGGRGHNLQTNAGSADQRFEYEPNALTHKRRLPG